MAFAARAVQYEDQLYVKNQLYLKLNPSAAKGIIHPSGEVNMDAFTAAFQPLLQDVQITSIQTPFFKAHDDNLKRVICITFEPVASLDALVDNLNKHGDSEYAEPVPAVEFFDAYIPNDLGANNFEGQWYLHSIQAQQAWGIAKGSKDITVAVVDQAIDIDHPDLAGVIWTNPGEVPNNGIDDDENGYVDDVHGYDVADDDPDPKPDNQNQPHGTHVAGLVSAETDNAIGIASIGFQLSIVSVKCADHTNTRAEHYKGIIYAANTGADIVQCSWGGYGFSITNKNVIEYAQQQGCLVVCSAGNNGSNILAYPAAYRGVISVGATNILDRMSGLSNYNAELSVSAPGEDILSTLPSSGYEIWSGTSMAAPIVSGLLGLMKSHYPEISNDDLKTCLLTTTDPIEINSVKYEGRTGAGRINAYKAIVCVDNLKKATGITKLVRQTLNIYPNPTANVAYIILPASRTGDISMTATDVVGRQVMNEQYGSNFRGPIAIDTENWASGIYLLELRQGSNLSQGKLVVK